MRSPLGGAWQEVYGEKTPTFCFCSIQSEIYGTGSPAVSLVQDSDSEHMFGMASRFNIYSDLVISLNSFLDINVLIYQYQCNVSEIELEISEIELQISEIKLEIS